MNQQEAIKRLAIYHNVNESSVYIPQYFLDRNIWVLWKHEFIESENRMGKIPYNPRTRYRSAKKPKFSKIPSHYKPARTTAAETWGSFDQAINALTAEENAAEQFNGVGIVLSPADDLVFIDLDHCMDELDEPKKEAQEIIKDFDDQYIELSQSGEGLHIFALGKIPESCKKGVEMYTEGRFCACTFKTYEGHSYEPGTKQAEITALYLRYKDQTGTGETAEEKPETSSTARRIDPADSLTHKLTTEELIALIEQSKQGEKFKALYHDGNTDGYKSPSDADMALCGLLAFWTDGDAEWMDSIFRTSALMRKKWDDRRKKSTYGWNTIAEAIKNCNEFYTEGISRIRSENAAAAFSSDPDEDAPRFSRCPRNPDTDKTFSAELLAVLKYLDPADNKSKFKGGDDIALGKLYATVYKSIARYNTTAKCWYLFNGTVWLPDQGNKTAGLLAQLLQKGLTGYLYQIPPQDDRQNYIKVIGKLGNHNQREKMLQDAAMYTHFKTEELDSNPDMLNCLNGVYDLANHTFSPDHDADLLLSKCSNIIYDPEASAEEWDAFINDVLENNTEKISFLKRALGLALTENISEECFFILLGTQTRNGKSTCLETLGYALGDYSESAAPETFAKQARRSSGPSPDRAKLKGCRFLRVSEPDKGMLLDEGFIKQATGGEEISARFLNENEFSFKPKFKLFMNVNNPPVITDMTIFDSDRVHVITFDRFYTAAERDHKLKAKLRKPAAISGLFNWCIEGLKDYEQQGLNPPACVVQATASYRDNSDKIKCFFNECMIPDQAGRESLTEVYRSYVAWCTASGYAPGSKRTFKNESKKRGLFLEQGTVKGQTRRNLIIGYRIVAFDED